MKDISRYIPCRGPTREVRPANGQRFTHYELQTFVGGNIEAICKTRDGHVLYCNEEGKLRTALVNERATLIYHTECGPHDLVVGNCVLVAKNHREGS